MPMYSLNFIANTAVFAAILKPGDKILGFDLSHGGHLTHGFVNFSGKLYKPHFYGVEEATGTLDYDKIEAKAEEVMPNLSLQVLLPILETLILNVSELLQIK